MEFGILSIVPPIVAIVLSLITKEVITSLLFGILAGGLIFTGGDVIAAFESVFGLMGEKLGDNSLMVMFLALLGSLVMVMNMAGGSFAYGQWASKKIKSKPAAKLATVALGMLIFIDDYFNCLTVGAVMKPITDENKISRAKLAHMIDSTAAPVCIIAPISSWAASVIAIIGDTGVENPMGKFLGTIPLNAYAILTLTSMIYFAFSKTELFSMEKYERNDTSIMVSDEKLGYSHSDKGKVLDLVLPIITLIGVTVLMMLRTGGYFADPSIGMGAGFGDADVNLSLVIGSVVAIIVAFIMYIPRQLLTFKQFMDGIIEGIKSMISAIVILTLAWTIGGVTSDTYLNTGGYIAGVIQESTMPMWILPSIIFIVACFLSFSTGTAWGTFGILVPIMVPILVHTNHMHYLEIVLAAIFSGSVFGDHCSPISDTTILSSAGAGCDHIIHVSSQIPYAVIIAIASITGFLVAGVTGMNMLVVPVGLVVMFTVIIISQKITINKLGKA